MTKLFLPCLIFRAIIDARIASREVLELVLGTLIQIGCGFGLGYLGLRLVGLQSKRELLLPIAFVNSSNLPFPLVLANFGPDGLSRAVVCYLTTSVLLFSVGNMVLNGAARLGETIKEPTVWAAALAASLRLLQVEPPEALLRPVKLASTAAVPCMLFVFGDTLARTKLVATREAITTTALRYLTGAAALGISLTFLRPDGMVRSILTLYALLPSAVASVLLARRADRDAAALAAAILLATLVSIGLLPYLLARLH